MRRLLIHASPPRTGHATPEGALSAAFRHPDQPRARIAADLLGGSHITGGAWKEEACEVVFSNGCVLNVEARDHKVVWEVLPDGHPVEPATYQPVELVLTSDRVTFFDPTTILAELKNTEFKMLFVNEMGLLLYTGGNPIMWFHAWSAGDPARDFLFGHLSDT